MTRESTMYVIGPNNNEKQVIQLGYFQKEADMESYQKIFTKDFV